MKYIVQFVKPFRGWKDIAGSYFNDVEKAIARSIEAVKDGYKSVRIIDADGKVVRCWKNGA